MSLTKLSIEIIVWQNSAIYFVVSSYMDYPANVWDSSVGASVLESTILVGFGNMELKTSWF